MNKNQILKALKQGNYTIELETNCNCRIDWEITENTLRPIINSDACYVTKVLYITDNKEQVAEYIAGESLNVFSMDKDEFEEMLINNDLEHILNELYISDNEENSDHNSNMKESLKEFITENEYICYIDYPRNFGNEYTCILVNKNANIEGIPENAEKIEAEEFAEKYLQKDDACTQYYIGFEFIK